MKKFIEVYDDIIPLDLADSIKNTVLKQTEYVFVPNITSALPTDYNPGFASGFLKREIGEYRQNCFYFNQIVYLLCQYKKINLHDIIQGRVFLHLPSPNPNPNNIHIDLPYPHWVCLYYVNDSDGDTILFDDNNNEIKRVIPKKGRIVFFDGSIKHCSSSPSKIHRAVINFDFIGEYFNN